MSDNKHKEEKIYRLPIEWHYPDGFKSSYATNFIVQHTQHEFYLSFFDFPPPILLGSPEERQQTLEELNSVQVSAVARIVVSPERMEELIEILQENLRKYQEKLNNEEEE